MVHRCVGFFLIASCPAAFGQILFPIFSGTLSRPIAFVTQSTAPSTSSCSPLTVTIPAPGAGDILIVNSGNLPSTFDVATVALSGASSWVQTVHDGDTTLNIENDQWSGIVGMGAATSLTITYSGPVSSCWANVSEWSGINPDSRVDGGGAAQVTNGSASSSTGAYSTVVGQDLIMAVVCLSNPASITAFPAGYTQLTLPVGGDCQASYLLAAPEGAQSASWSFSSTQRSFTTIIGYRP